MRILVPGVGGAAFRNDGPEAGVREHVDPGCRGHLRCRRGDDVFTAVLRESAEVIAEHEVRGLRLRRRLRLRAVRPGRRQPGHALVDEDPAVHLFDQAPADLGNDDARRGLQQDAVFVRDLLGIADEDPARPVDGVCFRAGRDQPDDLVLQPLPVADVFLVPDHEIDDEALQAPVSVAADELPCELDVRGIRDLQQHDRVIAGNGVSPETRLTPLVAHQHAGVGAHRRVRVDHVAGKPAVDPGVIRRRVDLPQHHAAMGPCQVEDAVREMAVPVLGGEREAGIARIGGSRHQVERGRFAGIEFDPAPDRHDRLEHGTVAAGKRGAALERERGRGRAAAPEETGPVGLEARRAGNGAVRCDEVEHPRRRVGGGSRPARTQDRASLRHDFGLHEQVAERRLQGVGGLWGQHHLGVARDFDRPALFCMIGQAQPAQLDVVLGRNDDLRVGLAVEVAAAELGAAFGEHRLVAFRPPERRLVRRRPVLAAGHVAQINE